TDLTGNTTGKYERLTLSAGMDRNATMAATFTNSPAELRMFTLQYPGGLVDNDRDSDQMNDVGELLVVDDDPEDAYVVIDHVLPDDDYDADGYTNKAEIDVGGHPAVAGNPALDPNIAVSPAINYFGTVIAGDPSGPRTFTITNQGVSDLEIGTVALSGANPTNFIIQNDTCSDATLVESQNCTVDVVFIPTQGDNTAILVIPSNDPARNILEIPVAGLKLVTEAGDISGDGKVDLADVIYALQLLSNQIPPEFHAVAAVNTDGRIGLAEAGYILQKVAELR
ncbi:choice-of-anchor D domain-containing protein, partial [Thermodesulfobacteriota bacterium]